MTKRTAAKDAAVALRSMGWAALGFCMMAAARSAWAQSAEISGAMAELKNEAALGGTGSNVTVPPVGESVSAASPQAPADANYRLTADQFKGIQRLMEYLNHNTQYRDLPQGDHEFSIRTSDQDRSLIFIYRTVKPHLIGKPRTYVFSLWTSATGGEVDSRIEIQGNWDVGQINQAASDPSKLKGLRSKMLRSEQGSDGNRNEASLAEPSMRELLQEELKFWAVDFQPPAASGQASR